MSRSKRKLHLPKGFVAPRQRPTKGKLCLCMPIWQDSPAEFWMCFIDLVKNLWQSHPDFDMLVLNQGYIDFARNKLVATAAEKGATEILFLDQDMMFPPDLYWRLKAHDKPVVGALYFKRLAPFDPVAFNFQEKGAWAIDSIADYPEGLLKVDAVGMGATLIQMDAINAVLEHQMATGDKKPNPFRVYPPIGEDIFFCKHLQELDIGVYVDTTLKCRHMGANPVEEVHYLMQHEYGGLKQAFARLKELEAAQGNGRSNIDPLTLARIES